MPISHSNPTLVLVAFPVYFQNTREDLNEEVQIAMPASKTEWRKCTQATEGFGREPSHRLDRKVLELEDAAPVHDPLWALCSVPTMTLQMHPNSPGLAYVLTVCQYGAHLCKMLLLFFPAKKRQCRCIGHVSILPNQSRRVWGRRRTKCSLMAICSSWSPLDRDPQQLAPGEISQSRHL